VTDLENERDFLADQNSKLGTLLDEKQETVDRLYAENNRLGAECVRLRYGNRKKLTAREVAQIRELWETTAVSQAALARIYNVNPATISRTVRDIYHREVKP
jgi:predicted nuclease with TOPRIM domain